MKARLQTIAIFAAVLAFALLVAFTFYEFSMHPSWS